MFKSITAKTTKFVKLIIILTENFCVHLPN